ncbi:MAG TPA: hypothetical protein VIJ43_05085, partial [Burkholderiales bacterium]
SASAYTETSGIAGLLNNLGTLALDLGDDANCRTLCDERLTIMREIGNKHGGDSIRHVSSSARFDEHYGQGCAEVLAREDLSPRRKPSSSLKFGL